MIKKQLLITGATGFLGQRLVTNWLNRGWAVTLISRKPNAAYQLFGENIQVFKQIAALPKDTYFDAVINLAGEPIFANRWTTARKASITASRIALTETLVAYLAQLPKKPEVLISASAIGIYGAHNQAENQAITINSHSSFSECLCYDWEQTARKAEALNIRTCLLRTGLVLAADGGMLHKMLPAFRFGLGCQFGNGQQWMSWIHIQDWLAIVDYLLSHTELSGAFNATAPQPVTNQTFTQLLANYLHRPAFLTIPAAVLQLMFGEMAELLLTSQKCYSEKLMDSGFNFQYLSLDTTLSNFFPAKI